MAEVYLEGEESVSSRGRDVAASLQRDKGKGHTSGVVKAYDGDHRAEQRSLTEGHMSRDDVLRQMQSEIAYLRKRLDSKKRRRKDNASSSSDNSEANPGGIHPPMFEPTRSMTRASVSSGVRAKQLKVTKMPDTDGIYREDGSDAMGKALRQIAKSPFVTRINRAKLPRRFSQPLFTVYNGRTDPVEHVSHFCQKMAVYSNNEALMCRVFPSSLGPVAMRWFDALAEGSLRSFEELTRAFGAREGETLKTYSDRYWETYNEIDGDVESVAVRTFKVGLPTEYGLRKSLTMKAAVDMRQLMDRIDKYKWVEEDQMQSKGKMKGYLERKDLRVEGFQGIRPKRDFTSHPRTAEAPLVNSLFKEPVHHILEKIRHEPYFRPPNKMSGDASTRNQNLHCHYHQDKGHTTEKCRTLRDHLNQLIRAGKINHLLAKPNGNQEQLDTRKYWGQAPQPSLGTINVILTQPRGDFGKFPRVMTVQNKCGTEDVEENHQTNKRLRSSVALTLGFSDKDKEGTFQPHDDALVVMVRIGGYDVKRVLVDDGSGAEIMYPDLFNGLKLKEEDLEKYDHPLVGFDGNQVIPRGMIRLPVQVEGSEVQVNFIVVMAYSPYTAILARPWLHAMEAVSSTLHVMVKYPTGGSVGVLHGSQTVARQCLMSAIIRTGRGSLEAEVPETS
ncbi:uncharacterized protein LOC142611969 [Castanea sativa]|uniref:uncharacterized protein LOC142611969 n=1 Tax=Castanea sativa TaxID=21020 RepID=UPI003F64E1DA